MPENYFERFDSLFIDGRIPLGSTRMAWLRRRRPLKYLKLQALTILAAVVMLVRIWNDPRTRPYRGTYGRHLAS